MPQIVWKSSNDSEIIERKIAAICAVLSIAMFFGIILHCIHHLSTTKVFDKYVKFLLQTEILMNIFCIIGTMALAFLNNNYISSMSPQNFMIDSFCNVSQMTFFAYVIGKLLVYFIVSFKIYAAFENTFYAVSKTIYKRLLITYATSAAVIQMSYLILCVIGVGDDDEQMYIRVIDTDIVLCGHLSVRGTVQMILSMII